MFTSFDLLIDSLSVCFTFSHDLLHFARYHESRRALQTPITNPALKPVDSNPKTLSVYDPKIIKVEKKIHCVCLYYSITAAARSGFPSDPREEKRNKNYSIYFRKSFSYHVTLEPKTDEHEDDMKRENLPERNEKCKFDGNSGHNGTSNYDWADESAVGEIARLSSQNDSMV